MGRKKIWIPIAIAAMPILGLILYSQMRSEEYAPADNEIALHIQLDTKEDIGLLVYIHIAFRLGRKQAVDELTQRLRENGCPVVSESRMTGDGYYESCIIGIEGNQIELTE